MKKAQAAMEFLMTYGWALLVVLAAIGALAYFGVLNPGKFLPEQCSLIPGLACLDSKITQTGVDIKIANSLGRDITVTSAVVGDCSVNNNQTLLNGDQITLSLSGCDNGDIDSRFKEEIVISYFDSTSSFEKTARGTISGKIQ